MLFYISKFNLLRAQNNLDLTPSDFKTCTFGPNLCVCSAYHAWRPALPFQVMLVGDSGVGKTCLLVRFKDGAFLAGSFISTVGIDFRVSMHSWICV